MLLEVIYRQVEQEYVVVNTFDGVVVGRFYSRWDAEDFALDEEPNEAARVEREYLKGTLA
jgi:hypothetical protein